MEVRLAEQPVDLVQGEEPVEAGPVTTSYEQRPAFVVGFHELREGDGAE
jgi:hypothetical protein